jgi:hypothetical protein
MPSKNDSPPPSAAAWVFVSGAKMICLPHYRRWRKAPASRRWNIAAGDLPIG